MNILREITAFIDQEQLLSENQRLIAAVSGGADSLCLLHSLFRLGYRPIVAHLDHQLRSESKLEAAFVQQIALQLELEFVSENADVAGFAEQGASIEEAARILRYRFLVRVAQQHDIDVIATGHTSDDQAETVLMHFLRGAGPSGLRGMLSKTSLRDWVGITDDEGNGLSLVRPLLCVTHQQAEQYCEAQGLSPVLDSSNLDLRYYRNRLRHHLLPILEEYNPEIRNVLNRTGRVMAAEAAWLADTVAEYWSTVVCSRGEHALALRTDTFLTLPTALRRAILREMIHRLKPKLRDVGFEAVERASHFVKKNTRGKRIFLVGDLILSRCEDQFLLFDAEKEPLLPEYPQLVVDSPREIPIPGTVELGSGWILKAKEIRLSQGMRETIINDHTGRIAAMDAAKIKAALAIRARKPGDRIRPLGMKGTLKVADLFINHHVPRLVRTRWPLIVSGDQVLWVAGLCMSEDVRFTAETQEIVMLQLIDSAQGGEVSFDENR